MMKHKQNTRIRVYFSGRVQGVGFRYTVCRIADGFDVAGWVGNLEDGRVALVSEGTAHELEAFVQEIQTRMSGYIRTCEKHTEPPTNEFHGFVISHGIGIV